MSKEWTQTCYYTEILHHVLPQKLFIVEGIHIESREKGWNTAQEPLVLKNEGKIAKEMENCSEFSSSTPRFCGLIKKRTSGQEVLLNVLGTNMD